MIYTHFVEAIAAGLLKPLDVVPLSADQLGEIVSVSKVRQGKGEKQLQPVFTALRERYDCDILRCVQASL